MTAAAVFEKKIDALRVGVKTEMVLSSIAIEIKTAYLFDKGVGVFRVRTCVFALISQPSITQNTERPDQAALQLASDRTTDGISTDECHCMYRKKWNPK